MDKEKRRVWIQDWNLPGIYEKWKNIVSLCIMDFSQYKDSLMLL